MLDLLKLFHKVEDQDDVVTELQPSQQSVESLAGEYAALVREQLEQGGVQPACVEIDVRVAGAGRQGRPVFVAMLRLAHWERQSAARLLLGLPILEQRIKRLVRGSWLHEVSHFGGIWLHASGQLQDGPAMKDLRAMLQSLEAGDAGDRRDSVWSVPEAGSAAA